MSFESHQTKILIVAMSFAALVLAGCKKDEKKSAPSSTTLSGPYSGELNANSSLVISPGKVIAGKALAQSTDTIQGDPGRAEFEAGLYPKLKEYCSGSGCHSDNRYPFAAEAPFLAFDAFKQFANVDPEASQIIINIRANHNGVDPAWAEIVAPLVQEVSEKIAEGEAAAAE